MNEQERVKFLADEHLGKLARQLRFAGFDTLYLPGLDDTALLRIAREEDRILLSRDRELQHRDPHRVFPVHSIHLRNQMLEVAAAFDLAKFFAPFTRCTVCNTPLHKVDKYELEQKVPKRVFETFQLFKECPGCGRIYWKGDHYAKMLKRWEEVYREVRGKET